MYVNYTVTLDGCGGDFQAGPYPPEEAELHKRDIAGYFGVSKVYLDNQRDENRRLIGNEV